MAHLGPIASQKPAMHVNFIWNELDDVYYERFPASQGMFHVAAPNAASATDCIPAQLVLKTRVLQSNRRVISHCAHYYFNRTCNRGDQCFFLHAVSRAPTAAAVSNADSGDDDAEGGEHKAAVATTATTRADEDPLRRLWGRFLSDSNVPETPFDPETGAPVDVHSLEHQQHQHHHQQGGGNLYGYSAVYSQQQKSQQQSAEDLAEEEQSQFAENDADVDADEVEAEAEVDSEDVESRPPPPSYEYAAVTAMFDESSAASASAAPVVQYCTCGCGAPIEQPVSETYDFDNDAAEYYYAAQPQYHHHHHEQYTFATHTSLTTTTTTTTTTAMPPHNPAPAYHVGAQFAPQQLQPPRLHGASTSSSSALTNAFLYNEAVDDFTKPKPSSASTSASAPTPASSSISVPLPKSSNNTTSTTTTIASSAVPPHKVALAMPVPKSHGNATPPPFAQQYHQLLQQQQQQQQQQQFVNNASFATNFSIANDDSDDFEEPYDDANDHEAVDYFHHEYHQQHGHGNGSGKIIDEDTDSGVATPAPSVNSSPDHDCRVHHHNTVVKVTAPRYRHNPYSVRRSGIKVYETATTPTATTSQ